MNLKKIIKKDFESKLDVDLSFDTSKLEVNEVRKVNPRRILKYSSLALATTLLIGLSIPVISLLDIDSTYNEVKRRYTMNEIKVIENESYKKLNEVKYSSATQIYGVSNEYRESMNNFAYNVYKELGNENLSFSPIGLYSNLNIVSLASDNEIVLNQIDNVLGLNKEKRKENFLNMNRSNFFIKEEGTLQTYNAVFQSNRWNYNQEFIDDLTSHNVESYSLDFNKNDDINKMLDYIDDTLNERNYFSKKELEINEDTALYFITSLYFDNEWNSKYREDNNYDATFYNLNGNNVTREYMRHTIQYPIYIYDKYVSVYDYYKNNMKVQYLIPKDVNDNIYELLDGVNFLKEDEEKLNDNYFIDLSVPKFDFESYIDFNEIVKDIGLDSLFNENSLNRAFEYVDEYGFKLDFIKQKNKVLFNEKGTEIKSFTISMGMKATSMAPLDQYTIEVKLNSPFIYVVYDVNDLPLYIGNVSNL